MLYLFCNSSHTTNVSFFCQSLFCFLRDGGHMSTIPIGCKQWISPTNEMATMYTPDMFTLSKWEIDHCPWWIDKVKGQLIDAEKQKYKEIYHHLPVDVQQSSLEIRGTYISIMFLEYAFFFVCLNGLKFI